MQADFINLFFFMKIILTAKTIAHNHKLQPSPKKQPIKTVRYQRRRLYLSRFVFSKFCQQVNNKRFHSFENKAHIKQIDVQYGQCECFYYKLQLCPKNLIQKLFCKNITICVHCSRQQNISTTQIARWWFILLANNM